MEEIEYQSNGQPIAISFEDLKVKLGYPIHPPRIGSLGKALIKASKEGNRRSIGWLKHQLDELYKKDRQKFNKKKRKNGRNKNKPN